jgi:hypothetical protein
MTQNSKTCSILFWQLKKINVLQKQEAKNGVIDASIRMVSPDNFATC